VRLDSHPAARHPAATVASDNDDHCCHHNDDHRGASGSHTDHGVLLRPLGQPHPMMPLWVRTCVIGVALGLLVGYVVVMALLVA